MNDDELFITKFIKGMDILNQNKVPICVNINKVKGKDIQFKMTCNRNCEMSSFAYLIRKQILTDIDNGQKGYLFYIRPAHTKVLPRMSDKIGEIYDEYSRSDNWLYFDIDLENIYG